MTSANRAGIGESSATHAIIGESPAIRALRDLIAQVAPTELPVLVQGPTGVGKELVATAIHQASGRSGRYVTVNMSAVPEAMLESILFGHVRGAFTGALRDSAGFLLEADRGTLFLDEIGGIPGYAQAKLLRALEIRTFRPVGAACDRTSAFRMVSATNEPMDQMVADNRFRSDLLHRLSGIVLHVPALRDRLEDMPLLVQHLVERSSGVKVRITESAVRALQEHDWPGNVRELRHVIARALALTPSRTLDRASIAIAFEHGMGRRTSALPEARRQAVLETLERANWDTVDAAQRLGVHRATLYRWMRQYGIQGLRDYVSGGDIVR